MKLQVFLIALLCSFPAFSQSISSSDISVPAFVTDHLVVMAISRNTYISVSQPYDACSNVKKSTLTIATVDSSVKPITIKKWAVHDKRTPPAVNQHLVVICNWLSLLK